MKYSTIANIIVMILLFSSCTKQVPPVDPEEPKEEELSFEIIMSSVEVPRAENRIPLKHAPQALPKSAKARYPIFDGNTFHVTLPIQQQNAVSATEVYDEYLIPILKAMGFNRLDPKESFALPPDQGVKSRRAKTKGLMEQVNDEYQSNPKLLSPKTQDMLDALNGKADADTNASVSKALEMSAYKSIIRMRTIATLCRQSFFYAT